MFDININSVKLVREDHPEYNRVITCSDDVYRLIEGNLRLSERAEEYVYVLCLDTKNHVAGIHEISHGSLSYSIVQPREVFKCALLNNAYSILLVHNHPSGDPMPSSEDYEVTERLKQTGDLMGIPLVDHIIIGHAQYESMKEYVDL